MQAVRRVFPKPPKILQGRGLRLNKKEQDVNVFMKRVIPSSVRLIWSKEYWAKLTKYAGCTSSQSYFLSL